MSSQKGDKNKFNKKLERACFKPPGSLARKEAVNIVSTDFNLKENTIDTSNSPITIEQVSLQNTANTSSELSTNVDLQTEKNKHSDDSYEAESRPTNLKSFKASPRQTTSLHQKDTIEQLKSNSEHFSIKMAPGQAQRQNKEDENNFLPMPPQYGDIPHLNSDIVRQINQGDIIKGMNGKC